MYSYIKSEPHLWTVGFYAPDDKWHTDSDHDSPESAGKRVAYLNGQTPSPTGDRDCEELKERVSELEKGLGDLIFTASKLWDDAKPIKDTDIMKVTHPTIESAKQLLNL